MLKFLLFVGSNGEYLYDNRYGDGDVVFVYPETDFIGEGGWAGGQSVSLDDTVLLNIPGRDGSIWNTDGTVVSIEQDIDYLCLSVAVNWFGATLEGEADFVNESSQ